MPSFIERATNIVAESSSDEPGHKRMRIEDYLDMLNGYYGEMVAQNARLLRLLEAAEDRSATIMFLPSEIVHGTGALPPSQVQRKDVPQYALWQSAYITPIQEDNTSNPSIVSFFDEVMYANPYSGIGGVAIPFRLLQQPRTIGLWVQTTSAATCPIEVILSTRRL